MAKNNGVLLDRCEIFINIGSNFIPMNNELLLKLLTDRNRIVVPEFGAFIKRGEPGSQAIAFSPFLKKDDGVLAGAVAAETGVDAGQARDMIDEFVAGVNFALAGQGSYIIKGIGELRTGDNGAISLVVGETVSPAAPAGGVFAPQAPPPVQDAPRPQLEVPRQRPMPPGVQDGYIPRPQPRPMAGQPAGQQQGPPAGARPIPRPAPVPRPQQGAPRPAPQPRPLGRPVGPGMQQGQNRPPQPGQRPPGAPPQSGYPQQGQRPAGPGRLAPPRGGRPPARKGPPGKRPQGTPGKSKLDVWLIAAIIVAILAIILIVYGIFWETSQTVDLGDIVQQNITQ